MKGSPQAIVHILAIRFLEGDEIEFRGRVEKQGMKKCSLMAVVDGAEQEIQTIKMNDNLGGFRVKFPLFEELYFEIVDGEKRISPELGLDVWSLVSPEPCSYYRRENRIYYMADTKFVSAKATARRRLHFWAKRWLAILGRHDFSIISLRLAYAICKHFSRRPIWLVGDREEMAKDNGAAFFQYLNREHKNEVRSYFFIERGASDYAEMKKYGKVLAYGGWRHRLTFLLADKVLCSQTGHCPFGDDMPLVKDLFSYDFVFLQHGITRNDQSSMLSAFTTNINYFVVGTEEELGIISAPDYGYVADEVLLTGLPRYDLLKNSTGKLILFMPTWRLYLQDLSDEEFKKTEYFDFYNKLINDRKIVDAMTANKYTGIFMMHPNLLKRAHLFEGNDTTRIADDADYDYSKIFSESALMITDYSSTRLDFAYLKKPVIYAQFDKEKFFSGHTYKQGGVDYEKDEFGPVAYNYGETIEKIQDAITKGCKMDARYLRRVERFFAFSDHRNSERLYRRLTHEK